MYFLTVLSEQTKLARLPQVRQRLNSRVFTFFGFN